MKSLLRQSESGQKCGKMMELSTNMTGLLSWVSKTWNNGFESILFVIESVDLIITFRLPTSSSFEFFISYNLIAQSTKHATFSQEVRGFIPAPESSSFYWLPGWAVVSLWQNIKNCPNNSLETGSWDSWVADDGHEENMIWSAHLMIYLAGKCKYEFSAQARGMIKNVQCHSNL